MDYLIRFVQMHETFHQPETDALAEFNNLDIKWLSYSDEPCQTPFAVIRFEHATDPESAARKLLSRSILSLAIFELWGEGSDYDSLHSDIRRRTEHLWEGYRLASFRFDFDSFQGTRSLDEQRAIMDSLGYMDFRGPIRMKNSEYQFTIFEDFALDAQIPRRLFFGRLIAESGRKAMTTYNLKKRRYISTTSMDAELSLVTANLALAGPGKLAYDPFMGTGSFPLACAHFGSAVFGSDMDGRSVRGKKDRSVRANFEQYGTAALYLDGFTADLTNTPLRARRYLDAIVCDPPYGVREGLKVLGSSKPHLQQEVFLADGTPAHLGPGFIPPKRSYSFVRMLEDILDFASRMLVDDGRLCMWMPVAGAVHDEIAAEAGVEPTACESNTQEEEFAVPQHPALRLVSSCQQDFNKWSRRLLTYTRIEDGKVDSDALEAHLLQRAEHEAAVKTSIEKSTADDLNDFRRKYFRGFKD